MYSAVVTGSEINIANFKCDRRSSRCNGNWRKINKKLNTTVGLKSHSFMPPDCTEMNLVNLLISVILSIAGW